MLHAFLEQFGYMALFIGVFFEGETILVLAGFLAFQGYLHLDLVILIAFLGACAGDQLWYSLGRRYGDRILARNRRWRRLGDKALSRLRRRPALWVLGFRFVYGVRTVMPVAIGVSGYPPARFTLFNLIGAAVWAGALGLAAYHFGTLLQVTIGHIRRYEFYVLGGFLALGGVLWLNRYVRSRD